MLILKLMKLQKSTLELFLFKLKIILIVHKLLQIIAVEI